MIVGVILYKSFGREQEDCWYL